MKNLICFIALVFSLNACVTGNPTINTPTANSPEAQARSLTDKMKKSLVLDQTQTDKVMLVNVTNLKIIKKLKESNETSKIETTKEKYKSEIKQILNDNQYSKFLSDFSDL